MFTDATNEEIIRVMEDAWTSFFVYRKYSLKQRAAFMRAIAVEIENLGDELLKTAGEETNLPEARLRAERGRTIYQLNSYADACEKGDWMDIRIDTADSGKTPPRPDIRKMMIPLGPVVVFGAANFPFAYSTAGGDTASAFAAGCPVIVKAHPAHARTSEMVAGAIKKAAANNSLPAGIFAHVHGVSFEVGKALAEHPFTKAIGFTGSYAGGRQLYDWASQRKEPIPVFAEMSSVNPVFILPGKMKMASAEIAKQYAGSITLGTGQFCTNPGLLFALDNDDIKKFTESLAAEIQTSMPGTMLHAGIFKNYVETRANALAQENVETIAVASQEPKFNQGVPTIASVTSSAFIGNPLLQHEVFGPYSLIVRCRDLQDMLAAASHLEGQLTTTVMGNESDLEENEELLENLKYKCGRFIINGVPTGVEVCLAMHHGGPFPSTTDPRFSSVGADAIRRFARPLAFQNWTNEFLPNELKDENPLRIWRTVNTIPTRDAL
jgi:NADP-dependent aldehyde dehydrogenase